MTPTTPPPAPSPGKPTDNDGFPHFDHARQLTPLELNSLRYDNRHTVLTPALLDKMAAARS